MALTQDPKVLAGLWKKMKDIASPEMEKALRDAIANTVNPQAVIGHGHVHFRGGNGGAVSYALGGAAQGGGGGGMSAGPTDPMASDARRKNMIGMRMRIPDGGRYPFDKLETHYDEGASKVHVFVCQDKKDPVILTDDANLFPSDQLIAQLNLIRR